MGPCILRSQKDNPCWHNAGFTLTRESPALPARSRSVRRAYGRWAALPQRSPFIPFPSMEQRTSSHLGTGRDGGDKGSFRASLLPSSHLLRRSVFLASPCALWGPAPVHRWPLHPVHLVVLSPSRCWPLVVSFHLSQLIATLPVNTLQLFLCAAQIFLPVTDLSSSLVPCTGKTSMGERSLTSSLFYPLSSRFLFFIFWDVICMQ